MQRLRGAPVAAQDDLVQLLRAKGILTAVEAAQLAQPNVAGAPPAGTDGVTARFKDGAIFENAAQGFSFALNGRLQADYRSFPNSRFNTGAIDTFEVRRARFGANAVFGRHYEAEITGDFGSSAKLDTAYLNIGWWQSAQLRLGLFKMPFSLEEWTSSNYTGFQERALGNAQAPGKERGLMLHGAPITGTTYALALSNGNGGASTDDNDGKDIIGRVTLNVAELARKKNTVLHIGVAASEGARPVGDVVANGRTEARGVTFFDPAAFTGTRTEVGRRGLEAALAFGPLKLQAEAIGTRYEGASAAGVSYERDLKAYYAGFTWLVTGEHYAESYKNGVLSHPAKVELRPARRAWRDRARSALQPAVCGRFQRHESDGHRSAWRGAGQ
ncbi:MAG: OprO/OprP family phosphate-selective porin [Burkholderiales bacterium]